MSPFFPRWQSHCDSYVRYGSCNDRRLPEGGVLHELIRVLKDGSETCAVAPISHSVNHSGDYRAIVAERCGQHVNRVLEVLGLRLTELPNVRGLDATDETQTRIGNARDDEVERM